MVEEFQKRISNEFEITEIVRFHEMMRNKERESHTSPEHNLCIEYKYEPTNNPFGVPFEIILSGCSDECIEKEIKFIKAKLKENQQH